MTAPPHFCESAVLEHKPPLSWNLLDVDHEGFCTDLEGMTPAVENIGNEQAVHLSSRFSGNGTSQLFVPWFTEAMKSDCCSPLQQGTMPMLKTPLESEAGEHGVSRPKEASSLPHWMDPTRVHSGRNGEKGPKVETLSPGPSTPMQAPPLPQQKPRETPESYTIISATSMAQAFQPTKASWGPHTTSRLPQGSSAPMQDTVQSQKENILSLSTPTLYSSQRSSQPLQRGVLALPTMHNRVGHPPLNRALATLGTPKTPLVNDDLQLHLHSKSVIQGDSNLSTSSSSVERDRLNMTNDRSGLGPKAEPHDHFMDAGLSLGFNLPQYSGSIKTPSGLVWENGTRNGSHAGVSFAPKTPTEGMVFLHLSQGGAMSGLTEMSEEGRGHDGKGKLVQGQSSHQHNSSNDSPNGEVERSLSQVQEHFFALRAERSAHLFTDPMHDRPKKRMKRRMLDPTITSYEARERNLDMDEDQDGEKNGNFVGDHEDSGNSITMDGSSKNPLQSSREKVLDKVLAKILEMPMSEPKTMVVKKTPKRVHNSNPNLLPMRSEMSMLDSLEISNGKSPQTAPHFLFTPSSTPGINSNLANIRVLPQRVSELRDTVNAQGIETILESSQGACDGSSIWQPPLASRLYTVSAYSPMPTSNQTLSVGEPSLPLTLNFSPKAPLPLQVLSPKATAGLPSAEEEWGKSLALSATPGVSPTEMESSTSEPKPLSYQERFVQLQVYLKKCDEDDQSYLLHALRSLSAAARSGHAVGLEQRAMWLSVEEGKEMARVKSLNVMGQRTNSRCQMDVGCTPQGPRLPAFSIPSDSRQHHLLSSTNSPPHIRMLMAGSTPSSAYMATPNFT